MKQFKIRLVKKHLLFDYNGQTVLVDTGSPVTIHRTNSSFEFCGKNYPTFSLMASVLNDTEKFVEEKIDVLAGLNILQDYNVLIDYKNESIIFYDQNEAVDFSAKYQVPIQIVSPLPIVPSAHVTVGAKIGGKHLNVVVDTGACIQYVDDSFTTGMTSLRTENDFRPDSGDFTTPIFPLEVQMGGDTLNMEFGNAGPDVLTELGLLGSKGIIGYDFFSQRKVLLDFKNNVMKWE